MFDVRINTLRYPSVSRPISVNLLAGFCCCQLIVVVCASGVGRCAGQGTVLLSAPSADYWFFCTTRFNERPIALGLSVTRTHTRTQAHTYCTSKSACHNSWFLSRRAVTLTDAEGASALGPGRMYIKWDAWLVLAPDFSRIQTTSRGFVHKAKHKSIELMLLRNLPPWCCGACDWKPSISFLSFFLPSAASPVIQRMWGLWCLLLASYWTGSGSRLIIAMVLIFVHRTV